MKSLGIAAAVGSAVVAGAVALTLTLTSVPDPAAPDPAPAGARLDLVVLLVTDGGPNTTAFGTRLRADGVPYRIVDLRDTGRPLLTPQFLADADGPNFQAVVLPNADPFGGSAELDAVHDYERRYGIRQVDAFQWPGPAVGLGASAYSGTLDGTTGTVTRQGLAGPFGYLRGPVPFEDNAPGKPESYGYLAQPAAAASAAFTPLVRTKAADGTGGVLVGTHREADREELMLTFSFNAAQQQFALLAPGVVEWVTRGLHLGYRRNYLSVQVDDVLMSDTRWSVSGDCTPGENCSGGQQTQNIRMTPADVDHAVRWQAEHNFTLDLIYNGGSEEATTSEAGGGGLTGALLAAKDQFRWTNHTYSHQFLGCEQDLAVVPWRCVGGTGDPRFAGEGLIRDEIARNVSWGKSHNLALEPEELVTGEHSGLRILPQQRQDNPYLAPALESTGIRWLAADASRMPAQERIGRATTVPRYPINLFFNVGTAAEEVDEYNWLYTTRAAGGSGICTDRPDTTTCRAPIDVRTGFRSTLVPLESRLTLSRVLANDPRPHYVHQANLAEERLLFPVLDAVLDQYNRLFAGSAPLVGQRLSAAGATLLRQTRWTDAVAAGKAGAYLAGGRIVAHAPQDVEVPLTVPAGSTADGAAFGDPYAGVFSAWAGARTRVLIP